MKIIDVTLIEKSIDYNFDREPKHFEDEINLGQDLRIGPLCEYSNKIIKECMPRSPNKLVSWKYCPYGIYREDAPGPVGDWDSDKRLSTCFALSRLVHPTNISYYYSSQLVFENRSQSPKIYPSGIRGWGAHAFIIDVSTNWLGDEDVEHLRELLGAYDQEKLPKRVKRAMWYFEYASWTWYVDIRWTLITTALEALIHTDERKRKGQGVTNQFIERLMKLSKKIVDLNLTRKQLKDMYNYRSGIAHGQGLEKFNEKERSLYIIMENSLRTIVKKAILNDKFAEIFKNDDSIRQNLDP